MNTSTNYQKHTCDGDDDNCDDDGTLASNYHDYYGVEYVTGYVFDVEALEQHFDLEMFLYFCFEQNYLYYLLGLFAARSLLSG